MPKRILDSIYNESGNLPNRCTQALGDRIREARVEAKMSQGELAENAHFRQSSISKIESGIRAATSQEILYLSYALHKPLMYFFPEEFREEFEEEELTTLQKELILHACQLSRDDLRNLIAQVRAVADPGRQPYGCHLEKDIKNNRHQHNK
jgi:transcriptional regulator with XRE-family HTH domain